MDTQPIINAYALPGIRAPKTTKIAKSSMDKVIEVIFDVIQQETGITHEDFVSFARKREQVFARKLFYYFMRMFTQASLSKLGELTGPEGQPRDHTTILHNLSSLKDLMATEPETACTVTKLEGKIRQRLLMI